MHLRRTRLIFFKGAFVAPLLFLYLACSNDEVAVSQLAQSFHGAMIEQENVRITYSDSGLSKIRVVAGVLEDFSEEEELPRQVFRKGFRVSILASDGQESGFVKAEKALRRLKDQVWVLSGNVEVQQEGGNSLYTDAMEWDRMNQEFRSESKVRIIDKGEEVQGKGFTAKEDLSQYTIFAVSGHFEGDENYRE
ncbi:MAG: LPS export ABC transporter periplasmic protein LptC [Schleiferiaceae bacterium]|nr:LPS export ABC transporter periplasmic protein LptC [Schleiferiaceae bacterium]